jgi:hypothetical protein
MVWLPWRTGSENASTVEVKRRVTTRTRSKSNVCNTEWKRSACKILYVLKVKGRYDCSNVGNEAGKKRTQRNATQRNASKQQNKVGNGRGITNVSLLPLPTPKAVPMQMRMCRWVLCKNSSAVSRHLHVVARVGAGGRTGGAGSTATFCIFEAVCWLSPRLESRLRLCGLRSDGCSAGAAASARVVLGTSGSPVVVAAGLVGRTAWSSEASLTQWLWRHLHSSCAASNFRPWSRRLSTMSWDIFIS